MIVTCDDCELTYDDEVRLTYCPHEYLGSGGYCREHDLFACQFHEKE